MVAKARRIMVKSILKNLISFIKSIPAFISGIRSVSSYQRKQYSEEAIHKVFNVRYQNGRLVADDDSLSLITLQNKEILRKYYSAL